MDVGEDGDDRVTVTVVSDEGRTDLETARGRTLRGLLCDNDLSPYTRLTERTNCGGRGLCATCGVRFPDGGPAPEHWHDRLAARYGYPRLSCQVTVTEDLVVEIPDKRVWGSRE
ncbi:MAG: 2Fe-2S iron-sulfur cluster-binding protein [Haloferacaceae archaeon]